MFVALIFCLTLLSLNCAQLYSKPGECTPNADVGECDYTCFSDLHCGGAQKCCRTACGGTFCANPVSRRFKSLQSSEKYVTSFKTIPIMCVFCS